jgi:hypothetical protein
VSSKRKDVDLKIGDSVVVKVGVQDPDFGVDLGGWQGRIVCTDVSEREGSLVTIRWDSVTLKNMPTPLIEQCEERGLGWTEFVLLAREVEPTAPRDTEQDVERVSEKLARQHAWTHLGEQGQRIGQMLASVDPEDEVDDMYA